MKKTKKPTTKESPIWIIKGDSESGDHYKSKRYNHKPTKQDKKDYILNETPEEINIDGPGDFGSYVYLKIEKL
jgi:hypothetical protein